MIAVISGLSFDKLVKKGILPANPQQIDLPKNFKFWIEAKKRLSETQYTSKFFISMLVDGVKESRIVMRWILFGVLLAGLIRTFISPELSSSYFGPTIAGLGLTVLTATIMEVCSEGSTPVTADLLIRANALGNSFAFLMTGVATDYTEIMVLKDATKSWRTLFFYHCSQYHRL